MNYQKIYDQIIKRSQSETRVKGNGTYYEQHHILPKCLGGCDNDDNKTLLTAREHFLCHWILHRLNPDNSKLTHAFHMMCFAKGRLQSRYTPSSRAIKEAKDAHANCLRVSMRGEKNHMYGRKRPDVAQRNSILKKGVASSLIGTTRPNFIGELHPRFGKQHTSESKANMSASKRGISQPKIECPYCGKIGGNSNIKRYHFENCKKIQSS